MLYKLIMAIKVPRDGRNPRQKTALTGGMHSWALSSSPKAGVEGQSPSSSFTQLLSTYCMLDILLKKTDTDCTSMERYRPTGETDIRQGNESIMSARGQGHNGRKTECKTGSDRGEGKQFWVGG